MSTMPWYVSGCVYMGVATFPGGVHACVPGRVGVCTCMMGEGSSTGQEGVPRS